VLKLARKYADEHYKEGKNNNTIFGAWYGMNYQPWCAMFVSYCFNKAGAGELVAAQSKKGFASCSAAVRYFKGKKRLVNVKHPKAGDIVFMNFDRNPDADHVGIVISNDVKSKVLHTVEGNTVNPNGSGDQTNGDGAFYKTRPYRYIVAVVRPAWETLDDVKASVPKQAAAPVVESKPVVAKTSPKLAAKKPVFYVVKSGDSYWSIGKEFGVDFRKLQKLNAGKALHPDDKIRIK
jgi:LysM repeat protein